MNLAYRAMLFARDVHSDQIRKYTGNPYADHLAEVAGITSTVANGFEVSSQIMIATAWLHDCVEDQNVSVQTLLEKFGDEVAAGVLLLSDLETGNRAERKAATCVRLAAAPAWVQTIKCADLISNASSIVKHEPKFAMTYLAESRALLEAMTKADHRLRDVASSIAEYSQQ